MPQKPLDRSRCFRHSWPCTKTLENTHSSKLAEVCGILLFFGGMVASLKFLPHYMLLASYPYIKVGAYVCFRDFIPTRSQQEYTSTNAAPSLAPRFFLSTTHGLHNRPAYPSSFPQSSGTSTRVSDPLWRCCRRENALRSCLHLGRRRAAWSRASVVDSNRWRHRLKG